MDDGLEYSLLPQGVSDSESFSEDECNHKTAIKLNICEESGVLLKRHESKSKYGKSTRFLIMSAIVANLTEMKIHFGSLSKQRKCAFFASIMFCLGSVWIFLSGIACSENIVCPRIL